jgi:hypothetical protein
MRKITGISFAIGTAAVLTLAAAVPANAADTNATVTVTGGTVSISAPASVGLSAAAPGATAAATIPSVEVTDTRAGTAGWTASFSSTAFTSATLTDQTIPAANVSYVPTTAVVTGTATVTGSTASAGAGAVQTASAVTGNNTAIWDGTVSVAIPSDALAATDYTATMTESVL